MHLALVVPKLACRSDLAGGVFDTEWVLDLAASHRIRLFVDQATPGSDRVRRGGVATTISARRWVVGLDGARTSSDAMTAHRLEAESEEDPLDAIVYESSWPTDLGWFEPALLSVPRIVALGAPFYDLEVTFDDPRLFSRHARRIWATASLMASADFILSDVSPAAFRLVEGRLPPRLGTLEVPLPPPAVEPPRRGWLIVAATSLGPGSLANLMTRVAARTGADPNLTFLVLVRQPTGGARALDEAVILGCPAALRRQTVVLSAGDPSAAECMAAADFVLAASPAELGVRAVAEAAAEKGYCLLESSAVESASPSPAFPCPLALRRRAMEVVPARMADPVGVALTSLRTAASDMAAETFVLLHAPSAEVAGLRPHLLRELQGADVVVWSRPDATFGAPDPAWVYPHALAVRNANLEALAHAGRHATTLWDLIGWALSLEWIDRSRLVLLPGRESWEFRYVAATTHEATAWHPPRGVLPPPRFLPVEVAVPPPAPPVAPVLGSPPPPAPTPSALEWARRRRWTDRLRLALPWRLDLLERAMRGRW